VKVIDLRDSSGSGDVDISTIMKITSNNNREDDSIQVLSVRKLKVKIYFLQEKEKKKNFL
jgi:hypothetical protein